MRRRGRRGSATRAARAAVVELLAAVGPERVAQTPAAERPGSLRWAHPAVRDGGSAPRSVGVLEQRDQALAVEAGRRFEAGELDDRRVDVEQLDGCLHHGAGVREPGRRHDQRHVQRLLEERVLAHQPAVLAQVEAVVADQHDHRVLPGVRAVERVEHHADLRVGERDAGSVGRERLATEGRIGHEPRRLAADERQTRERLRLRLHGDRGHVGEVVRPDTARARSPRGGRGRSSAPAPPTSRGGGRTPRRRKRTWACARAGARPRVGRVGRRAGRGRRRVLSPRGRGAPPRRRSGRAPRSHPDALPGRPSGSRRASGRSCPPRPCGRRAPRTAPAAAARARAAAGPRSARRPCARAATRSASRRATGCTSPPARTRARSARRGRRAGRSPASSRAHPRRRAAW